MSQSRLRGQPLIVVDLPNERRRSHDRAQLVPNQLPGRIWQRGRRRETLEGVTSKAGSLLIETSVGPHGASASPSLTGRPGMSSTGR